jgi:hypothetical protein
MEIPMNADTNTIPDEELFDVEGEAETAEEDSSLVEAPANEPSSTIVDLGADNDEAAITEVDGPDESYGAKVNQRINKMTGQHNQELAGKNREIANLKRQVFDAQGAALDSTVSDLKGRSSSLTENLKQAIEDGDVDKQLELQVELGDVRADLRHAEKQVDPSRRTAPTDGGDGTAPAPATPTSPGDPLAGLKPKAKAWAEKKGFANWTDSQRGLTLGIDSELTREGFDQNTDDYFIELDRRLEIKFPELYSSSDEFDPTPTPRPNVETNVRAPAPIPPKAGNSGNKVTLDRSDYANMRRFKLDPSNPEHVKAYAAEKRKGA